MPDKETEPAKTAEGHDNDETIEFDPDIGARRVYDILPYSHWRVKQILNDYCNARAVRMRAYKEGRYPGYKQRYNIYDNDTGELIREDMRLDDLRRIFACNGIPLCEDNRNQKAASFLETVNEISNNTED